MTVRVLGDYLAVRPPTMEAQEMHGNAVEVRHKSFFRNVVDRDR